MLARLQRWQLRWQFRLFQRHRHRTLVIEHIHGRPFVVLPDVFNPALFLSSEFLAHILPDYIQSNDSVLDIGTGSGVCAVFAALITQYVTAIDINPMAVRCASINALLNCVESHTIIIESDLFAAIPNQQYDVILFNPPYFRGVASDDYDHAWRSQDVVERFAEALPIHLTQNGYALVILSTNGDLPGFLNAFNTANLKTEAVASRDLISETLTIYKLTSEQ